MSNKILLTGASGLLGKELVKLMPELITPSHREFDIAKKLPKKRVDLIIHAAAFTNTAKGETGAGRKAMNEVNVDGTLNLLKTYSNTPIIFISSEYAMHPINHYSATKAIGELFTQLYAKNYLIIRTLFKPRPYPFGLAFGDQWTRGDYVDTIAKLIVKEIKNWDRKTNQTVHVGTKRKTMFELAKQTNPNVIMNSVEDIKGVKIPTDYQ